LIWQYPIGWVSDKVDRRHLVIMLTGFGGVSVFMGMALTQYQLVLYTLAFVAGGIANPLYSLLIAYTNDYLEQDDMAAASGGLIFLNGVGAIGMPLLVGWSMTTFGPNSYFVLLATLFLSITAYALYRTTKRAPTPVDETSAYAAVLPQSSPIAVEVAQEVAIEMAQEED